MTNKHPKRCPTNTMIMIETVSRCSHVAEIVNAIGSGVSNNHILIFKNIYLIKTLSSKEKKTLETFSITKKK